MWPSSAAIPFEFVSIAVSDGISMGHEGMRASLVSREIITDSVEVVMHAERFDAFVGLAGCDKSLPAMMMAAGRLDLPMVFVYAGSILPGHLGDRALDVVSVFEAVGAYAAGECSAEELGEIERHACPGEGACAGMFTANTMASISEAIGLALPGSSSPPAVDPRRDEIAAESGRAVMRLLENGTRARQILTKEAFENAIAVAMALGGSTNAVLHLLAIAHEARVDLSIDDFSRIGKRVPHLADMKPHGRFHMVDLDAVGGVPMVMKELLDAGLLHGDCLTVTGRTMGENLEALAPPAPDGTVAHPLSDPIHADGGLAILRGSLAPEGAVVKIAGLDAPSFEGVARVFDGEDAAMEAILAGSITPGTVVVIRYEGPKGGPGMREMLAVDRRHEGRRPRGRLRPRHRRALQRRHPWLLRRPCRTRGHRRRSHRPRGRRRPHRARHEDGTPRRPRRRVRAGSAAGRLEAARAPLRHRSPRQVRPPRHGGGARGRHRALSAACPARASLCRRRIGRGGLRAPAASVILTLVRSLDSLLVLIT